MKGMKDSVQVSTPSLHEHNFGHTINTTFDFYQFRPVLIQEMYPKDQLEVGVSDYFRAQPLAGAVYGRFIKKYAAFFVPYRILWDKWGDFLTGGSNGRLEFDVPQVNLSDFASVAGKLYDQIETYPADTHARFNAEAVYRHMLDYWKDLGIPSELFFGQSEDNLIAGLREDIDKFKWPVFSILACRRIWFDWFRDQNLIGDDVEDDYCSKNVTGDLPIDFAPEGYEVFTGSMRNLLAPLPIPVEKDYFTTAMTEPQRGNAAFVPVSLPSANLNPGLVPDTGFNTELSVKVTGDGSVSYIGTTDSQDQFISNDIIGMFDYNLMRVAKGYQKFLEKNNIAGGAELQQLLAHWGTAPNPAVFQKSTYIGSFFDDMTLNEVVSPANIGDTSVAGEVSTKLNMSGHGTFNYTANEHGLFIIVQFARPENSYVGGIRREHLHGVLGNGRFDFFTPEMEKTGFQPMYAFEKTSAIFKRMAADIPYNYAVGYVPRYAETKRQYNEYRGQLANIQNANLRVTRDYDSYSQLAQRGLFINTGYTSVYGYPTDLQYDIFFAVVDPIADHFDGWIHFDIKCISERNEYSAPLIEDAKGNDITLPYAGVRM